MPGTLIARGNVVLEMVAAISLLPNGGTNIAANSTVETTYTVQGVQLNDFLEINKPSHTAGLSVGNIRASAANQIAVQFVNSTASPISPTTETYLLALTRCETATLPGSFA